MSRLFIMIMMFLFISTSAHARMWITHDGDKILGQTRICGARCSNDPSMTLATEEEYLQSKLPNKKLDFTVVTGSRVVNMTQVEIDVISQAKADAQALAEANRLTTLDDSMVVDRSSMVLTKADNAIDNIGSLDDSKVFLKKLVRYIVASQ